MIIKWILRVCLIIHYTTYCIVNYRISRVGKIWQPYITIIRYVYETKVLQACGRTINSVEVLNSLEIVAQE